MPTITLAAPIARWLGPSSSGDRLTNKDVSFPVVGAATTVRDALETLFVQKPQLRTYLLDDQGALRHHVAAFVNSVVVRDKQTLGEPVPADGEIFIMQALSGG